MRIRINVQPEAPEDTIVQSACYSVFYRNQKGLQSVSLPGQFTSASNVVQLSLWSSTEGIQPDRREEQRKADEEDQG
jgi:hypothetical protein